MSSTTKTTGATTPLLSKSITSTESKPIPSSSALAINGLALGRITLGLSALIAPTFTFGLLRLPIPAALTVLPRMWAGREIICGEFLWTAQDRKETKNALWLNMGVDAMDACGAAYGVASGTLGRLPGGLLFGGATMCLMMGGWGMRGYREDSD